MSTRVKITPASQIKPRARTWDCRRCGRALRSREMHLTHKGSSLEPYCGDCCNGYPQSLEVHRAAFPECAEDWHDAWDHAPALCADRQTFARWVDAERAERWAVDE